jgi:signal transduction histidine kinase
MAAAGAGWPSRQPSTIDHQPSTINHQPSTNMRDKVNILLVDDEPGKLLSYEAMLSSLGENLIKVNSGRRALECILSHEIAVVLVDVVMPDMDGFELATLIHQHPRYQKTALIFVSAVQIDDLDHLRGYECGAVDYVSVPVVPEILRARVSVFVELYRKTQELERLNRELEQRVAERTRALEATAARLREADRRKDQFLAMLAHELRNPLAPIRNAVAILKQSGPAEPRVQRIRDIIERQVGHMAHLLDDLLDVSRITRGKIELRPERLDLVGLVAHTAEDFREELERAGLTLTLELPAAPLWIEGDPTRLAQVVGNLLSNAAKFTPAGGEVGVRCSVFGVEDGSAGSDRSDRTPNTEHRTPNTAVITIRDTGIGIEPEMLPRIFDTFTQADRSLDRSRGGLGLGLALVKGMVEMHQGQVQVESPGPEQGTTFTIRLPLAVGQAASGAQLPAPGGKAAPSAQRPAPSRPSREPGAESREPPYRRRVLLIEDNADTAETLRELLEMAGYPVEVAHSGPEGIASAQQLPPERVICDIGLPGMDGYQVARALRQAPSTAGLSLIALSGYAQEEDLQRSREAGFDWHLRKPIEFSELVRLLQSAPGRRLAGAAVPGLSGSGPPTGAPPPLTTTNESR